MVEHVLVLRRTGNKVPMTEGRDKWWDEECVKVPTYCPCEPMASEDPLFILYVSCTNCDSLTKDLWIHWKPQRCRPLDRRIPPRCIPHCQIRV